MPRAGSSAPRLLSFLVSAAALSAHLTDAFARSPVRAPTRREERRNRPHLPRASPSSGDGAAAAAAAPSPPPSPERMTPDRLESRLMKSMRSTCREYGMVEDGDHIMACVSGGKDSATMLHLLLNLRRRLDRPGGTRFRVTAVHLDQGQPGYDGAPLISWLNSIGVDYRIVTEDTYGIVKEKTPEGKTFCSLCSRLRRGVLYNVAKDLGCNKLSLGHHGDDAIETLLLNAVHAGQLKSMPARYYSPDGGVHVIRPLITCGEGDILSFAEAMDFPVLPCNLCGSRPDAQRARVKMLVGTLDALNPNARGNFVRALGDVRPSHLLDVGLREACGLDGATGLAVERERARLVHGIEGGAGATEAGVGVNGGCAGDEDGTNGAPVRQELPLTFIENLL